MRKVVFVHHTRSRKKGNRRRPSREPGRPGRRQYANLIVEISQDLLAVGMTDGDGANTRADHTQGRLVQVGRQYVLGLVSAQCPEQPEGHRMVPPLRLPGGRLEELCQLWSNTMPRSCQVPAIAPPSRGWRCGSRGGRSRRRPGGSAPPGRPVFLPGRRDSRTRRGCPRAAKRRPKPSQGPALEALGVVNQAAGDRPLQAPGMRVSADGQRRVGNLEQAQVHESPRLFKRGSRAGSSAALPAGRCRLSRRRPRPGRFRDRP